MRTDPMPIITDNAVWGPGYSHSAAAPMAATPSRTDRASMVDIVPDGFKLCSTGSLPVHEEGTQDPAPAARPTVLDGAHHRQSVGRSTRRSPVRETYACSIPIPPMSARSTTPFSGPEAAPCPAFAERRRSRSAGPVYIDVTPDEVPVISDRGRAARVSSWPPDFPATASASDREQVAWPPISHPAPTPSSTPGRSAFRASSAVRARRRPHRSRSKGRTVFSRHLPTA